MKYTIWKADLLSTNKEFCYTLYIMHLILEMFNFPRFVMSTFVLRIKNIFSLALLHFVTLRSLYLKMQKKMFVYSCSHCQNVNIWIMCL